MKHLQKFKFFNINEDVSNGHGYKFIMPVKIEAILNDNNLDWESFLRKDHSDLYREIMEAETPCESCNGNGTADDETCPDCMGSRKNSSKKKYFDEQLEAYIKELPGGKHDSWLNFLKGFNQEYKLDQLDPDSQEQVFEIISQDYNESKLEQWFKKFPLQSLRAVDVMDSGIVIEAKSEIPLSREQLEQVRSYIQGQCSDGWGEGYSQHERQELAKIIDVDPKQYHIYVHTYWHDRRNDQIGKVKNLNFAKDSSQELADANMFSEKVKANSNGI